MKTNPKQQQQTSTTTFDHFFKERCTLTMSDFLEPGNVCGQNLLRIVSQGNAVIAELHRLADLVPAVFRLERKEDQLAYGELLPDFGYFKLSDAFDRKVEADERLLAKDEELRETYIELLAKFYLAFESVHRYAVDLERYLAELEEGVYIQQSVDSVLLDYDGKQLLCEALHLLGVILLTLELAIEGPVRERMLVAYYRHYYSAVRSAAAADSNIDDVCNLVRSTGFLSSSSATAKRPPNYPEELFRRAKVRPAFARLVIGRLRSDDLYNMIASYPRPEHRSTGLAHQAAMLFVCLYFAPDILHGEFAVMREIVDKFFADNFVLSVYMGTIVNLVEQWEPYRAAKAALANTLELKNVRSVAASHRAALQELNPKLAGLLKEGQVQLGEEAILSRAADHLNTSRRANVTLRWMMLHTVPLPGAFFGAEGAACVKRARSLREAIVAELKFNPLELFRLLLNTSEFELRLRERYRGLLSDRQAKLAEYRREAHERIAELAEVFGGSRPLNRLEPSEELQRWFTAFAGQIAELEFPAEEGGGGSKSQQQRTSRRIIALIKALEEVQEFQQLEANMHVKQFLAETHSLLHLMVKTLSIREEVLVTAQLIADLSYAWRIIDHCFTQFMQDGIKGDPGLVAQLRAAFLKLASALDLPLLRISQAASPELVAVSRYYSSELVAYVRKVLHIIPETMFALMASIIQIQTSSLKELPTRLMKDQLRAYAQLEERQQIAQLTHSISVFTEGVLAMKTTLVGVIQIDPKRLLEDGIRRELVRQVARALHRGLQFSPAAATSSSSSSKNASSTAVAAAAELHSKLAALLQVMNGYRRSFEYIQDYVCINGLKMWQEELSRIVNYNVEQECNAFMRQKVLDYQSLYQSRAIPIPVYLPLDPYSLTFVGRLVRQITRLSDPKATLYVYPLSAWYDARSRLEVLDGTKLFGNILKCLGVTGTNGIDRLLSFQIVAELNKALGEIDGHFTRNKSITDCFAQISGCLSSETPNGIITSKSFVAYYLPLVSRLSKVFARLAESIGRIGQLQLLRLSLTYELATASRFQARQLSSALSALNGALLTELSQQQCLIANQATTAGAEAQPALMTPTSSSSSSNVLLLKEEESPLLFELSNYLEYNGLSDPLLKVYLARRRLPAHLDTVLLLLLIAQLPKFVYVRETSALGPTAASLKAGDAVDGTPFVLGLLTLLRQFHGELASQFLRLCSQLATALAPETPAAAAQASKQLGGPLEAANVLQFLQHFALFGGYSRRQIGEYLPAVLLDHFHSLKL